MFLGSGVGGALRYAVTHLINNRWRGEFPLGTLLVNVTGCLAIGLFAVALSGPLSREEHRLLVLAGLLGGYTTFSAFGRETLTLLQDGRGMLAILNVVLSNVLGLVAVWIGWAIARRLCGAQSL